MEFFAHCAFEPSLVFQWHSVQVLTLDETGQVYRTSFDPRVLDFFEPYAMNKFIYYKIELEDRSKRHPKITKPNFYKNSKFQSSITLKIVCKLFIIILLSFYYHFTNVFLKKLMCRESSDPRTSERTCINSAANWCVMPFTLVK